MDQRIRIEIDVAADGKLAIVYAGAATKSIQAYFQDDRLYMVLVAAPPAAFPEIVGALTDKYGKPKVDKREEIKTRMGATFEQRTVAWPFGGGYISARRYDGDIRLGLAPSVHVFVVAHRKVV